jgi:mRNA interferase RelE/StbE
MIYNVLFSESAKSQFTKLDRQAQERILAVLERAKISPERYIHRLAEDPAYRLRAGDYRILLDIDQKNQNMLVLKIGHRQSIYK